mmetsp:Transcript_25849/g.46005  ORF Transcript_25849/g.46005 Transcript_25849/m.46005 type:complete len:87 (-) Transcript_25849:211-471(-)|eukprot:CAMPEP_0177755664 /NCGR_PEP_ID=MMETSP0491_2-20121128/2688_1 /TAXON_ID=63592 /ORGANISM="Tetraselmis chuii, Strain PLY429" /LENGTH=86 /DNA_ID=CAMNT_0019271179 /DNA_START=392 /DNA_END=652 /DNA_ORIENTATION=-
MRTRSSTDWQPIPDTDDDGGGGTTESSSRRPPSSAALELRAGEQVDCPSGDAGDISLVKGGFGVSGGPVVVLRLEYFGFRPTGDAK